MLMNRCRLPRSVTARTARGRLGTALNAVHTLDGKVVPARRVLSHVYGAHPVAHTAHEPLPPKIQDFRILGHAKSEPPH